MEEGKGKSEEKTGGGEEETKGIEVNGGEGEKEMRKEGRKGRNR